MDEHIYNIISNKISGNQLDKESRQELSNWLKDVNNQSIYQELENVWKISGNLSYSMPVDVDKEWTIFKEKRNTNRKTKIQKLSIISIAASIILAIGLFVNFNSQPVLYKYATNQNHFILPDNSEIWLNEDSELELTRQFGKKERIVKLKGEAFFDVQKGQKPFVILTKQGVSVKVLGTSFNVNSTNNNRVNLQVISGVVEFMGKDSNNKEIVKKGTAATYYIDKKKIVTGSVNNNELSWHTGEFEFNNQSLNEVVKMLSEYLSVEIEMPEYVLKNTYSGRFNKPTVDDVAEILSQALSLNYSISKQKLTFYKASTIK